MRDEAIHNGESLPQGWEVKTLGEIGKVVSGGTPSTSNKDNFDGEIAWITPADLSGYKEKYISKGKRNLSEQGLKNSSARLLPPNSILFSSRAPIGYVAIASNALCTNQGFKNLIPNSNVSSEYIYYFLLHSKRLAESVASGTTFKEISATNFSKLPIPPTPCNPKSNRADFRIQICAFGEVGAVCECKPRKSTKAQILTFKPSVQG